MTEKLCYCQKYRRRLWNPHNFYAENEKDRLIRTHGKELEEIMAISLCPIIEYTKDKGTFDEDTMTKLFEECIRRVTTCGMHHLKYDIFRGYSKFQWELSKLRQIIENHIKNYISDINPDFIYSIFERWLYQSREMKEINYYDFTLLDRNEIYIQYR